MTKDFPLDKYTPILTLGEMDLLRRNFEIVNQQSGIASLVFYQHLFTLDPSLSPLFHTSIELQGRKLMEALEFTLSTMENPMELVPMLEAMGRRHVTYGTRDEHYLTMTKAMLQTLRETLAQNFTARSEDVWTRALQFISAAMIRGATEAQEFLRDEASDPPDQAS